MSRKKIEYVIDAMEEAKLPTKKQWALEIQREILARIHEPCFHRPEWLNVVAGLTSEPRLQITTRPYSPEKVEEIRRRTEEWNQAGMEVLELVQRWADDEEKEAEG